MSSTITPNMSLVVPTVGAEPGPQWAADINNSLTIIDQHSHVPGSGVPITPSALNINSDLTMIGNNLTNIRSARFTPQASPLALGSDVGCAYVSGVDLYFNDVSGNQIRITQSGGVAGTPGSIANLTSPASATYVASNSTFVWQSAANTPAIMDASSLIIRNLTLGSFGLTLEAPAAMGSDFTITLPSLPSAASVLTIDNSGLMAAANLLVDVLMPPGSIIAFGGSSTPPGRWLLCDGTAVSRTTYAALFAAISTNYGFGDGATTFNLPDFRGQFLRGTDLGSGKDPDAASRTAMNPGGNTGDNVGSIQPNGNLVHTHGISDPGHAHNVIAVGVGNVYDYNLTLGTGAPTTTLHLEGANGPNATPTHVDVQPTGITGTQNSGGSESRPTNAYVNFLIKY